MGVIKENFSYQSDEKQKPYYCNIYKSYLKKSIYNYILDVNVLRGTAVGISEQILMERMKV